jgi:hypothetical protein
MIKNEKIFEPQSHETTEKFKTTKQYYILKLYSMYSLRSNTMFSIFSYSEIYLQ